MPTYWISTICLDHVQRAVAGGFTQADHGADTRLRRLARGDGLVFYSPRTSMQGGVPLQQFTALGTVVGDAPFAADETISVRGKDVRPWRLAMTFEEVVAVPARDLLEPLSFVRDKRRWGYPFRRGLFEVSAADFAVIADALRVPVAADAQ